jgi:hypothetical protein
MSGQLRRGLMPPFRSTGSKSPPQRLTAKCGLQWCCGSAKISCKQDYPSPLLCVMSMVATSCAPAGTGPDGKHTVWKCDSGNSDDNEFFSAQIPPDPPLASTVSSSYSWPRPLQKGIVTSSTNTGLVASSLRASSTTASWPGTTRAGHQGPRNVGGRIA